MINRKLSLTYFLKIGWTAKQFEIFVDMLDTSTPILVLLHAGGGTGKTFVTCQIFEELATQS
jgi:hypothetical protein